MVEKTDLSDPATLFGFFEYLQLYFLLLISQILVNKKRELKWQYKTVILGEIENEYRNTKLEKL